MCPISDKLILYTCSASNAVIAKHYWIYYRWMENKHMTPLGDSIVINSIDPQTDQANKELLLKVINQQQVFHSELHPAEKDRIALTFTTGEKEQVKYGFEFMAGEWHEIAFDPLKWISQYHEEKFGKIENALRSPYMYRM